MVQMARDGGGNLRSLLFGEVRANKIYAGRTSAPMMHVDLPKAQFRELSADDLRQLPVPDASFRQRQLERLARFGRSYAYGVFVDGQLAHISWLLPPAAVRTEVPAILHIKNDEAEITACETLPQFRGRGIYGFAIRKLFATGRRQGFARIYMKTAWDNKPSQKGILSAGLKKAGIALSIVPPLFGGRTVVIRLYR
jgi:hypothetical protein